MDLSNENVVHIKDGEVEYIQFKRLLEYSDIITHAFSVGKDVNFKGMKIVDGQIVKCNTEKMLCDYRKLCTSLNLEKNDIVRPIQTHSTNVKIVEEKVLEEEPDIYVEKYLETDGLITRRKDTILGTTSADCILLMFFDPVTKTIANIHSGWKGTYGQIASKTVKKMKTELHVNPENLICCMCPSIRKCHFEVRKDVKDLFEEKFKDIVDISKIIEKQPCEKGTDEKWNIDTIELNKMLLVQDGLKPENIIDSKICTVCNSDKLHSYRVEKENFGLETAIIALR